MSGGPGRELSDADERMAHQVAEPIGVVAEPSAHWRESYFFVAHRQDEPGDVLIMTMATAPHRGIMDSYQMGRVAGEPFFARQFRRLGDDPETTTVGPSTVRIVRPYQVIQLAVDGTHPHTRVGFELTFTARTRPYLTGRGSLSLDGELVWDQRQMFQSGWFDGWFDHDGTRHEVRRWWGQRDHSWGVREHRKAPMWMWLAVQLPEGMLGVWCWERQDGGRVFLDGCWAPAGDGEPEPVTAFEHDLRWLGAERRPVDYRGAGEDVHGLAGSVTVRLAGGRRLRIEGDGGWAARYGRRGGGLHQMSVRTDDGRCGTAIYEVTGAGHHRYFPEPLARTGAAAAE